MSERKPTKAKLEENKEEQPKHQKTNEKDNIFKKDFDVEDPELIIDEDTDEERKKTFKETFKNIKLIIEGYFDPIPSKKKKKKRKLEELARSSDEINRVNTHFVQQQNKQKNQDEREN